MAVYKKTYRRYDGGLTPDWSRLWIIPRYAMEDMHRSRFFRMFFLASFLYPVLAAFVVYVYHRLSVFESLGIPPPRIISIDTQFFLTFLGFQSMLAFFVAAFAGPGLVSPDLANNALPLYLARPFSRSQYVFGKLSVLAFLLSLMTWVPGLLLFGLQGYMEGGNWFSENLRIASGLFFGAWIWILVLSFLALALSAWVKWKPLAGGLLFGCFFVAAGFGVHINIVLRTKWGHLLNISHLIGSVWVSLFEQPMRRGAGAVFFRVARGEEIPIGCCWAMLIGVCVLCLYLLARKIRGAEVAR
jgi:ABC-2 type transport system permease protein